MDGLSIDDEATADKQAPDAEGTQEAAQEQEGSVAPEVEEADKGPGEDAGGEEGEVQGEGESGQEESHQEKEDDAPI